MEDLGPNWVRLAANGTNLELFKIILLYILAPGQKCTLSWSQMGHKMCLLLIDVSWIYAYILAR